MLPILSTMLTDFPTMLTDALLMRLKLLKKLSDIVLCVLLTVRFCILISSQPGDQTPDTDLIDSLTIRHTLSRSLFHRRPPFSRLSSHLLRVQDFPLTSPLSVCFPPGHQTAGHQVQRPFGPPPPQMPRCPNPVTGLHNPVAHAAPTSLLIAPGPLRAPDV